MYSEICVSAVEPHNCEAAFSSASCTRRLKAPMCSKHLENSSVPSFWMKDADIFVLGHTNSCSFGQYGGRIFSLHTKRGGGPDLSDLCQVLLFGHKRPPLLSSSLLDFDASALPTLMSNLILPQCWSF